MLEHWISYFVWGITWAVRSGLGCLWPHPESWLHLCFRGHWPYQFRHDYCGCQGLMLDHLQPSSYANCTNGNKSMCLCVCTYTLSSCPSKLKQSSRAWNLTKIAESWKLSRWNNAPCFCRFFFENPWGPGRCGARKMGCRFWLGAQGWEALAWICAPTFHLCPWVSKVGCCSDTEHWEQQYNHQFNKIWAVILSESWWSKIENLFWSLLCWYWIFKHFVLVWLLSKCIGGS